MQAKKKTSKQKFHLTCLSKARTLYDVIRFLLLMDATTKKMVEKLRELQMEIGKLSREAQAIQKTLEILGIKPEEVLSTSALKKGIDERYFETQPFTRTSLVETCRLVLIHNRGRRLTKTQVEYLASAGGYTFKTEDSVNSVEVTLRRLAESGFCKVEKGVGPHGSKYWWDTEDIEPPKLDEEETA